MSEMKVIGILGGMGPLATADIFKKIIENTIAKCDQEHIPVLIDSNTKISDRTSYILNGENSPLPELIKSAKRLQSSGADALIIPCNTAHFFVPEIEKNIKIPIIKITDAVICKVKSHYKNTKRIAVIATVGTHIGKVYETPILNAGFEIVEIADNLNNKIMQCIYDGVKAGRTEQFKAQFQNCLDEIADMNADIIVAGCTEIPILLEYTKPKIAVIDATLELALAAIKFAKSAE